MSSGESHSDGDPPPPQQQRKRKLSEAIAGEERPSPVVKQSQAASSDLHQDAVAELTAAVGPNNSTSAPSAPNGVLRPHHSAPVVKPAVAADGEDKKDNDEDDGSASVSSIDSSVLEHAVHQFEDSPYTYTATDEAFTADESKQMRARLKDVGIEQFIDETMDVSYRKLGSAFGMDPKLPVDEDLFTKLLFMAIMRWFRKRERLGAYNTIDDVVSLIRSAHSIMVITGAGISTSLGIPDFRSQGTGFYDRLRQQGFDCAEDLFEIRSFDEDPSNFYTLAGELFPTKQRWTPTHAFIKLLQDKNKLQTNYTQNIDNLESIAGILPEKLIQAHGSFATASCRKCKHQVPGTAIFPSILAKQVAYCPVCPPPTSKPAAAPKPTKTKKSTKARRHSHSDSSSSESNPTPNLGSGVMKPDITFFNEPLSDNFFTRFTKTDAPLVDLVLVIGTSLKVAPVSEMCNYIPAAIPQVYVSREPVRHHEFDVQILGECDVVVYELAKRLGWGGEIEGHEMVPKGGWTVDVEAFEEGKEGFWVVKTLQEPGMDGKDGEQAKDGGQDEDEE